MQKIYVTIKIKIKKGLPPNLSVHIYNIINNYVLPFFISESYWQSPISKLVN
jgi:hypothetical protein